MDDAERVRFGDRLARLQHEVHRLVGRKLALLREQRREIAALEVLHDHVRRAALELADVGDAGDVLALDLHGGARLALEAREGLRVGERLRQEEFQRDLLVELDVVRRDDDAHPANAEDALDAVLSRKDVALFDAGGAAVQTLFSHRLTRYPKAHNGERHRCPEGRGTRVPT